MSKLDHLQKKAIESAEKFARDSHEINHELQSMLPVELEEAGKKIFCDGDVVAAAFVTDGLLALCRQAGVGGGE